MSKTSNQLEDVFQEVSEYFATVPGITVTPGESTPPEQYTITYKLNGACKENDGEVYICDTHTVSISLPFGFPHFPPNCLPQSPTFHPDFDSSAICIGDAWENNKSIVQLILHIGRMIAGELYSKTNAFNEEAAEWYTHNSEQLPFDNATFEQQIPDAPVTEEEFDDFESIDTLDDDDFVESFSLEQEEVLETELDTHRLQLMAKQKRFHALSRELKLITELFDERIRLETESQNALNAAADLFREAEKLEHQGKQKEALAKYHSIDKLVSDYPKLQDAKDRVQQAFDLLGDWVNGAHNVSSTDANTDETATPGTVAKESHRMFFDDKNAVGKNTLFFYAICLGSFAFIGTLAFFFLFLNSSLNSAKQNFSECQDLLEKNDFQAAELKCSKALNLNSKIRVIKQKEKKELNAKINALLQSQKFRQGLAGNILVNGKYVPISAKNFIFAFMTAKQDGDAFYKQKRWHQAALSYTKALKAAKQTSFIDEALLIETGRLTRLAELNEMMQSGEEALEESDWKKATEAFGTALQLAQGNPNVPAEDIAQLELLSNRAEFNILRETGHQDFDNSHWETALSNYQRALKLAKKLDLVESDTITGLEENIARTKIYMAIEKGKDAFTDSRWDEVISQYEKAIVLLRENSKLLSSINTEESGEKLSRIMLHVEIIQDKQDLAKLLKADAYEPAVDKLLEIRKTVTESRFANRPEFKVISEEVSTQLADIKNKLLIGQLSTYLTDNFEKLFLKHYPASSGSKLSAPTVEYLKKIDSNLLFRMQCTEKSGGRPLRLQMDYLYSPADGSWSFYSED
jgi:ubiquitin-protein ligase